MIIHTRKDTLKIDINQLASRENHYNDKYPHPMNTTVILQKGHEIIAEMYLCNLITMMGIFNEMKCGGSPGPVIDKFSHLLRKEHGDAAVSRVCGII